jgi:hypothetical protein
MTRAKLLTLLLLTLFILSSVPAFADLYVAPPAAAPGTPAASAGGTPSALTPTSSAAPKVYYAFKTQDGRQGVWDAPSGTASAQVLQQVQSQFGGASLIFPTPIAKSLADFKKAHPSAEFGAYGEGTAQNTRYLNLGPLFLDQDPVTGEVRTLVKIGNIQYEYSGVVSQLGVQTDLKTGAQTLTYANKPVNPNVDDNGKLYFEVIDAKGAATGESIQPIPQGAIDFAPNGERQILDSKNNVLGTFSIAEWQSGGFESKQDTLVAAAAQLSAQGASLQGAKLVNGQFVYHSTLGKDVVVSGDALTVTRGTLTTDGSGIDTTKDYQTTTFGDKGQVAERVVKSGDTTTTYTFTKERWTINDNQGELQSLTVLRKPDGSLVGAEVSSGLYYNPESGKYFDVAGKELAGKDLDKALENNEGAATNVKLADAGQEQLLAAQPGLWSQLLTGDNIGGMLKQLASGYEEWRGIGAYGSLFIGNQQLAERRQRINDAFCSVGLGIDCITEKICEGYSDRTSGANTIVTVVPGQAVHAAAHLEAEKSETTYVQNASGSYAVSLYHVTFYASSPDDANDVQLTFYYEGGTYNWYPAPGQHIEKGGSVSAQGNGAIVKYSPREYTQVCIILAQGIRTGTGGSASRLCVPIVASGISPSGVAPAAAQNASSTSSGGGSSPAAPTSIPGGGF